MEAIFLKPLAPAPEYYEDPYKKPGPGEGSKKIMDDFGIKMRDFNSGKDLYARGQMWRFEHGWPSMPKWPPWDNGPWSEGEPSTARILNNSPRSICEEGVEAFEMLELSISPDND